MGRIRAACGKNARIQSRRGKRSPRLAVSGGAAAAPQADASEKARAQSAYSNRQPQSERLPSKSGACITI